VQGTQKNFNKVRSTFQLSFPQGQEKNKEIDKQDTEKDQEQDEDFEKMFTLRTTATQMQKEVNEKMKKNKAIKGNNENFQVKVADLETELKKIVADRDRHKDFYAVLMKNKIESKVVIDSQKRLMDKYTFITEQISSRPATGKQRPCTASGIRVGLAKK
jgi:flagellar motor protein MotB